MTSADPGCNLPHSGGGANPETGASGFLHDLLRHLPWDQHERHGLTAGDLTHKSNWEAASETYVSYEDLRVWIDATCPCGERLYHHMDGEGVAEFLNTLPGAR